jgi:hypothetical protein
MNSVITTFLTYSIDPQRGKKWDADFEMIRTLSDSCVHHNIHLIVLTDSDVPDTAPTAEYIRIQSGGNPYFERWRLIGEYLSNSTHIDRVWCVDATDTELLREPFDAIRCDRLLCGSEYRTIGGTIKWIKKNHSARYKILESFLHKTLLNAGLLGGSREMIIKFCADMTPIASDNTDMVLFNYLLHTHYRHETGWLHTTFKQYQTAHPTALWRHK